MEEQDDNSAPDTEDTIEDPSWISESEPIDVSDDDENLGEEQTMDERSEIEED